MKAKLLTFIFVLLLPHCGFSPIYQTNNESNFNISIINTKGDQYINKLITNKINKISKNNSKNKINLKINSTFSKEIVSKDTKGSPTEYQLKAITNFKIQNENNKKEISFNEKQNIKNISDIFELKNYENTIKTNFAISIIRNLNLQLLNEK